VVLVHRKDPPEQVEGGEVHAGELRASDGHGVVRGLRLRPQHPAAPERREAGLRRAGGERFRQLIQLRHPVVSNGHRNVAGQDLGRSLPFQRPSGPVVQLGDDRVEIGEGVDGQVGSLREVLPEHPVGVLV